VELYLFSPYKPSMRGQGKLCFAKIRKERQQGKKGKRKERAFVFIRTCEVVRKIIVISIV
jgi:hypothetical protein